MSSSAGRSKVIRRKGAGQSHNHSHSVASHGFDLPVLPDAVDIFDTTLRDGSQQEGLSLTVDDKLRVAEQLDHLGVTFIEGGWPGANHKDEEFFARAPAELRLSTRHAGRLRVHPPGRRAGRGRRGPAPTGEGEHRGRLHRGQGLEAPCHRGVAHDARRSRRHGSRLGELSPGPRSPGLLRRRALLRRIPGRSRVHPAGPARRRGGRGRGHRAVRHQRGHVAPRRRAHRGRRGGGLRVSGRGPLPQRLGLRGGQLHRRGPGRCHPRPGVCERLRGAHRKRRSVVRRSPTFRSSSMCGRSRPTASSGSRRCRTTSPSS